MSQLAPYIEPVVLTYEDITQFEGFEDISPQQAQELAQTLAIFSEIVLKTAHLKERTDQTLLGQNKVLTLGSNPVNKEAT
ncbi:MAG: hypothetical protein ACLGGV_09050 [Bacteroidia bacterium]